jgi:hypothetical protein
MFFQIHKRIKWGAVLFSAMVASIASSEANATPVLPPGTSAAVVDVTIDPGYNTITKITTFTKTTTSMGYGRYFTASPGSNEFFTVIPPAFTLVSAFSAGVISGLPTDPVGSPVNHLVIFGDFTSSELGEGFSTLFPGVSESSLINDLLTTPANQPLPSLDINPFTTDATTLGLYGGNGSSFDAVAFSTGTVIGSGTLSFVRAAVPEPFTLSLFGAGIAGAAALRRRKRA